MGLALMPFSVEGHRHIEQKSVAWFLVHLQFTDQEAGITRFPCQGHMDALRIPRIERPALQLGSCLGTYLKLVDLLGILRGRSIAMRK